MQQWPSQFSLARKRRSFAHTGRHFDRRHGYAFVPILDSVSRFCPLAMIHHVWRWCTCTQLVLSNPAGLACADSIYCVMKWIYEGAVNVNNEHISQKSLGASVTISSIFFFSSLYTCTGRPTVMYSCMMKMYRNMWTRPMSLSPAIKKNKFPHYFVRFNWLN